MIILQICWTSGLKIYKDLYSCPPDLWPVAGPSDTSDIVVYRVRNSERFAEQKVVNKIK